MNPLALFGLGAGASGVSGLLGSLFGGDDPKKLTPINIDPSKVQSETIAGNIAGAPGAFDLANLANSFSADQLGKMLETMLPGYGSLRDKGTDNIASLLRGEIPKDVERLLTQRAAEKGVTLGTSGSGFQTNDLLRNLGLTSLDITQKGLDSASKWIAAVPKAPQFDFTSMFFSPQQRLSFEFGQAQANQTTEKFNNWVDATPSKLERGFAGLFDTIGNAGGIVAGAGLYDWLGGGNRQGGGGYSADFFSRGPQ